ncbi:MAG TPA: hypothetical protein VF088_01220 [Pyrinomonadaceae bacterium]
MTQFRLAICLLLFFTALSWARPAQAQCVDSSQVNDFKVRNVKFKTLFGLIPKDLATRLDSHRGDSYSANKASEYINEIRQFYSTDPAQQKYEQLIANKLKLSIKAGRTSLECVEPVNPGECQAALPGTTQCVDVTIKRYFVDVDALDASPYLLLFPRSGLAALYGAMPRPLLALNPDFGAFQDKRFGPSASVDTTTDLLDLGKVLEGAPTPTAAATPPSAQPSVSREEEATFTFGPGNTSSQQEEPTVTANTSDTKLLLTLKGRKSLAKDFYDTSTKLSFARTKSLNVFQDVRFDLGFTGAHVPQGNGDYFRNALWLDFNTDLRLRRNIVNVGGGYRWSRNQFFINDGSVPAQLNSEHAFQMRAIGDGSVKQGLVRAAFWFENNSFAGRPGSYQRVAALAGYGKEFVIARKKVFHEISPPELDGPCWTSYADPKNPGKTQKNESTIGVEILAGIGRTWGDVPGYARFFGGSPSGQFLYDELNAPNMTRFPFGPVMRSLGENQGGMGNSILGGTSYWHANVNVSIPVPGWSRPLIPHEWVARSAKREGDEEFDGHVPARAIICRDLKSTVKTLVRVSGINLMVSQQARDLLTDAQKNDLRLTNKDNRTPDEERRLNEANAALAAAKAKTQPRIQDLFDNEILPITDFIADHANIFAAKPLVLFDVAQLTPGGSATSTRYALGGGVQLDVVLARFEFGYVAAIKRAPGDPRGNFFGRLIMRRLF